MTSLGRIDPPATPRLQRRAQDRSWDVLASLAPQGAAITARLAEGLSTVLACVNAISTAIASLPAEVQRRRAGGGFETAEDHPLARLIRDGANDFQSWPDFVEWLLASALLSGNGLAAVERDRAGAVTALSPIPWGAVSLQQLASGRLVFDVTGTTIFGATARPRRLLDGEVIWLRDRSDDGIVGRSRLQRAAGTVKPAWDLQEFVGSLYRNGVHPSGLLSTDTADPDPQQVADLRKTFLDAFTGPHRAARAMVLGAGWKWTSISVTPEDAEILASRRFTVEELARIYGVPPPVVGDLSHGTFTNSETAIRWFAQATLSPWVTKIEHEFHRSVFGAASRRTHRLDLDLSGLLRGDPETRWQSHKIAVEANILTTDEVRELEGWAPRGAAV